MLKTLCLLVCLLPLSSSFLQASDAPDELRRRAVRLQREGNFRDAALLFRALAEDAFATPRDAAFDLSSAAACFLMVHDADSVQTMLDAAAGRWAGSWRVLSVLTRLDGDMAGWRPVFDSEDARRRGLRRLLAAEPLLDAASDPATPEEKRDFYAAFASLVLRNRDGSRAWQLTSLTDVDARPEDDGGFPVYRIPARFAPVDSDGHPLFYATPASWEAAANDGERWMWVLGRIAASGDPDGQATADYRLAAFLRSQFGVETMADGWRMPSSDDGAADTGPFAVRTLSDDETIARLATGVQRFTLPGDRNHITLLRRVSESRNSAHRRAALADLAQIYENRQQYPKALALWAQLARGTEATDGLAITALEAIRRIAGNAGQLEPAPVAPAGSVTTLPYLFRNGTSVTLTAKRFDEHRLLRDIQDAIRAGSQELHEKAMFQSPEMIGHAVVSGDADRYVRETVAEWTVALQPLPDHFSRRTDIDLPFTSPGCYLIEAAMQGGNTSRIVLWINDLALVRRAAADSQFFFVADAVSGDPVPDATVTLAGYGREYDNRADSVRIIPEVFALRTDADGLASTPAARLHDKQWLMVAEAGDGRLAYLGFDMMWALDRPAAPPRRETAFVITDRPVYRPGQDIRFKVWAAEADYAGNSPVRADYPVRVIVTNPRGETVYDKSLVTDEYGGVDDALVLDGSAPLGAYAVQALGSSVFFRLEEYKKPEFRVKVGTPSAAAALGDVIPVTVTAEYYYGEPVQEAAVSYKITRSARTAAFVPTWRWDWLYGRGAWLQAGELIHPPFPREAPVIAAEGEGKLDADGRFRIALDTAADKALLGDRDHEYAVSVEVTDKSRRVIVGTGRVVAARSPFSVTAWTARGYYAAGQEIVAEVRAVTPLGGGVAASGSAALRRIRYAAAGTAPEETVSTLSVATDADGSETVRLTAPEAGQYRIAFTLTDDGGNTAEAAMPVTVRGKAGEGDFRFAALELVADRREYAVGDTVRLAVNAENKDAFVLLFLRDSGFPLPQRLENGSGIVDIPVTTADQPNFFVDALTVCNGRVYRETREIFVPPAEKTLTVRVTPDKESYAPGAKASFSVLVTDEAGKPVQGQAVVSVYDNAVEYFAGGFTLPDIRAAFWNWKRYHQQEVRDSLSRPAYSVARADDIAWQPIGIFGYQEADWTDGGMPPRGMQPVMGGLYAGAPRSAARMYAPQALGMRMNAPDAVMVTEAAVAMDMAMPAAPAGGMSLPVPASAPEPVMAEAVVRTEFADTALWLAALETAEDGTAEFSFTAPDNLTAWSIRTWVMGQGTRVGETEARVTTAKNVVIRPQAPRFLTQKDDVVLSANLHNYLPRAKEARVEIRLEGGMLALRDGEQAARPLTLPAGGEARADWSVRAVRPGTARIVMRLLTDEESDAAEVSLPVIVHGARLVRNYSGVMRGDDNVAEVEVTVPADRLAGQSRLELSFSPSLAATMVDALPYLLDYPYGCTEQTLNRFLPLVMTRKFLADTGISLADASRRLDAQRHDAQAAAWRETWAGPQDGPQQAPVFDDASVAGMVAAGVDRLAAMQNADGGWGWFSGPRESSWPHTTAVVVYGLMAAREYGAAIPMGVVDDGVNWLRAYQREQVARLASDRPEGVPEKAAADDTDAFIHMILAFDKRRVSDPGIRDYLYRDRLKLSRLGLAVFGLALHADSATNALAMVMDNLRQYVKTDTTLRTAWLDTAGGWVWWQHDPVATQAWYLKLLSRVDPNGETTAAVANHLVLNRKNGSYWNSTRDTALAVDALAEYAALSGETKADCTVSLYLDGALVLERRLTGEDILADHRFALDGVAVEEGTHRLRLERKGRGTVHYRGGLDVFSLEDPIPAAGHGLAISREYYRLTPEVAERGIPSRTGVSVPAREGKYRRERILLVEGENGVGPGLRLASGDVVEVELTLSTAGDYEYLVVEDMKAAGLEAVQLNSGYDGNALGAYVEYRDQKVVLFVRHLPRGEYRVAYRFRAEQPGWFSALPAVAGGMYATELRANSAEMKIAVE